MSAARAPKADSVRTLAADQAESGQPGRTGQLDQPGRRSGSRRVICLVGPGFRFTSGVSYYTCRLANALADQHDVSVIQMRQLLPRRLYPGWRRVGQPRARMSYSPQTRVYNGLNWWWGRSLIKALAFMRLRPPEMLVLQWWSATVLHSYLILALTGRLLGARVVLELHEMQDTGELRLAPARWYGQHGLRLLLRLCHGCVVHSAADRDALLAKHDLGKTRVGVAPHGPFDQYRPAVEQRPLGDSVIATVREAPRPDVVNLLYFGTIRPYKGLEDLLTVFNGLDELKVSRLWLTVVGETWEGWTEPARLIESSPHRARISFVNDYVPDEVVTEAFAHADVVVLPYRRSSSSGPLHVAMNWGLPVVVSSVGGLPEAAAGYDGAIFVPPGDCDALKEAISKASGLAGHRFADPRSWDDSVSALLAAAALSGPG
jgi:glycosyltransferase involved in cell wall biosynthesis